MLLGEGRISGGFLPCLLPEGCVTQIQSREHMGGDGCWIKDEQDLFTATDIG